MNEIYVDINGYNGQYQVSNLGNVKSFPVDGKRNRILKQEVTKTSSTTNYRRVTLSLNGSIKRFAVHRLVGEYFVANPDNKPIINHIDNNGENNNASNLEWVTHAENMIHAQKQGRLTEAQKKGALAISNKKKLETFNKAKTYIGQTFSKNKILHLINTVPETVSKTKFVIFCTNCKRSTRIVDKRYVDHHLIKDKTKWGCSLCRHQEDQEYIEKESKFREIIQLSMDGEYIATFSRQVDAGKAVNASSSSYIIRCANGEVESAHGFKWIFSDTET